ncbi:hypothetical protein [Bradyrhizobium sp. STM 3562]|uniref:hypothetical protein n=1 Tax=Bradyrhizobium sp. STM 3562 TaxID=578924 RepID=UPI00388D6400
MTASVQAALVAYALFVNGAEPQPAGKPIEYGWIRGLASAAFAAVLVIAGHLISRDNLKPIIWMNVMLLTVGRRAGIAPSANAPSQLRPSTDLVRLYMGFSR